MKDILDESQIQVMLDIETLSLEPNACIVSIGSVKFTLEDGVFDEFSVNTDPFDCKQIGLHIDPDTIAWWKKQDPAITALWKVDPQPLKTALLDFSTWFGTKSMPIWGNSPSFDCVVVKEAMKATGVSCPWTFRDECDYRTLCKLVTIPYTKPDDLHSALGDAKSQTTHLMKILKS